MHPPHCKQDNRQKESNNGRATLKKDRNGIIVLIAQFNIAGCWTKMDETHSQQNYAME